MSFYDHPDRQWDDARLTGPQPAGEPSRLRGLSSALTVLFILIAASSLLCAAAYASRIGYVDDVVETGQIDSDAAEAADAFVAGSEVLWVLLLLAIAPVFIVWQYRHAKNGRLLGATGGVAGPGWAIGGWFIPLANLVIPAVNLSANGSASDIEGKRAAVTDRRAPAIVVIWAVCFGIATVVSRGAGANLPDPEDGGYMEALQNADGLAAAANIGFLVAAVLAIVMVRQLTARQESALAARTAQFGGQTAYASWPAPPQGPYRQQPPPYTQPPTTPYTQDAPPARPAPPSPFAPPPGTPDAPGGAPAPPPVPPQP